MNAAAYLARIGFTGPARPDADTLRRLHLAHLYTVPFENLDISLGCKIDCDEERFLRKIVDLRRGGFWYEISAALPVAADFARFALRAAAHLHASHAGGKNHAFRPQAHSD